MPFFFSKQIVSIFARIDMEIHRHCYLHKRLHEPTAPTKQFPSNPLFTFEHQLSEMLSGKSGVSFISGVIGGCVRVTLLLTAIHHLIINGAPATTSSILWEKVRPVKRSTCASYNDPGNEIKKLKCVSTNTFPPPQYPKRMNQ